MWDIDRESAYMSPKRIALVTEYILNHFNQKTYRNERTYSYNVLTNISEVAADKRRSQVQEIKRKQQISGFNSIFAVSSVQAAKLYYVEFMKQMDEKPDKALKIALIYSYGANEDDPDGIIDEENPEDTSALDSTSRVFLEKAISDYVDLIDKLLTKFPLDEPQIIGEAAQKEFISLIGAILRMRNLLVSFDEFEGNELISERDFQDYLGRYQDLHDEWKNRREKTKLENIDDDIVFEIELIKQIEINIDYILLLVAKYHDSHCMDKELLITIKKAIEASPELRSKKDLIENFIAGINEVDDVMDEWHSYVAEEREKALQSIIEEEKLKSEETRQFIEGAFRDGTVKTTGTDIDKILPAVSRFGGGNRKEKKETVIEKLKAFFERFWNIG
ncbi:hypothetical protein [Ruminococcus sp.]|uniref:type I restriction endonuclease subunit R, EcoR124 family n=1 Tax=Ruminococcus sp. TaxID=41978 RepID=UPI00345D009F